MRYIPRESLAWISHLPRWGLPTLYGIFTFHSYHAQCLDFGEKNVEIESKSFVLKIGLNIRIRNNKFWIQAVLWIRIRIILGSWIRIRIKIEIWIRLQITVKSRIRFRIRIKVNTVGGSFRGSFWSIGGSKSGKMWVVESGSASNWRAGSGSATLDSGHCFKVRYPLSYSKKFAV